MNKNNKKYEKPKRFTVDEVMAIDKQIQKEEERKVFKMENKIDYSKLEKIKAKTGS